MLQQPTHPSCYEEDDRYLVCHVCTAAFDIAPPPRHELMASLAGETLAKMLSGGHLICAEPATSDEMEEAVSVHPALAPQLVHWIRGVFLVTSIDPGDDGDDVITAVNLARPIHESVLPEDLQEEFAKQSLYFGPTPSVDLRHGVGGPVAMSHCTALITVPAGFDPKPLPLKKVLPFGDEEAGEVVFAGELKDVAKLVRMHRHLIKPVRVLWGFGRWSRAQLLGELAQQEWGMCPGLAEDLETESLHLWEQVWAGRTVVAPPNEMSCPRETPRDLATPSAESAAIMADQRASLRAEVLQRARDAEARGEW
jgi:putative AlgH/UPF0301 family transcriptional regulator